MPRQAALTIPLLRGASPASRSTTFGLSQSQSYAVEPKVGPGRPEKNLLMRKKRGWRHAEGAMPPNLADDHVLTNAFPDTVRVEESTLLHLVKRDALRGLEGESGRGVWLSNTARASHALELLHGTKSIGS